MYFLNGKDYDGEFESKSFFYGYGCFETIRIKNYKLVFYKEHIKRLKESLKKLKIYNNCNYLEIEKKLLKLNIKNGVLKILITDKDLYYSYKKMEARESELGIKSSIIKNYYQNELGYMKTTNYLSNILAKEELKERDEFEGVFLNRKNIICEGTISNLFFIKDGVVKTPNLELNILPGITREKIIKIIKNLNHEIEEGFYSREEIVNADSIFFTNSLMKKGLLWVKEFENSEKIKSKIIFEIEKEYLKLIENVI